MPLLAHERPRRAVAAGRGPCRHRHANGGRTHAHGAAGAGPPRLGPQGVRRARLGVEGRIGRRDRGPAQAPRRLLRLEPRAVHPRRRPVARGRQGVRSALSRGARLQGQAPRQLGPQVPDRDLGPRGRAGRDEGLVQMVARGRRAARRGGARQGPGQKPQRPPLLLRVSGGGRGGRRNRRTSDRRHHAAGDDAGRHGGCGASGRPALSASDRQACSTAAGRPPDRDCRGRIFRSGKGRRRGQDHAGARLQRFRSRQAARGRGRASDQYPRCAGASDAQGQCRLLRGAGERQRSRPADRRGRWPGPLRRARAGSSR